MADEITYTVALRAIKSSIDITRSISNTTADMTGDAYSAGAQSIPTTANGTEITVATAVGTPGWSFFRNLDGTNFITIGYYNAATGPTYSPFITLKAGEACVVRLVADGTTLRALADTASVVLEHIIFEA